MEAAQPEGLLGLLIAVATSLIVLVFVFLRMVGVFRRRDGAHHRGLP
jgi:hypothetical protein